MLPALRVAACLAALLSCSSPAERAPEPTATAASSIAPRATAAAATVSSATPLLRFAVSGGGLGERTFGETLDDVNGSWLFDRRSRQTEVHLSGQQGSLRIGLDLSIPLRGPGTYEARSEYHGIDRRFIVALTDHATGERISLVAVEASATLATSPADPSWLEGRFQGRFAVGRRSSGRDVLDTPPGKRTFATISEGRFAIGFADTLRGRGRLWPQGSSAVLDRRKAALRGSGDP